MFSLNKSALECACKCWTDLDDAKITVWKPLVILVSTHSDYTVDICLQWTLIIPIICSITAKHIRSLSHSHKQKNYKQVDRHRQSEKNDDTRWYRETTQCEISNKITCCLCRLTNYWKWCCNLFRLWAAGMYLWLRLNKSNNSCAIALLSPTSGM